MYTVIAAMSPQSAWVRRETIQETEEVSVTSDYGASWQEVGTPVNWIDFVDEKVGWSIARISNGVAIRRTLDGGQSWSHTESFVEDLVGFSAISETEAWAIKRPLRRPGESPHPAILLHTANGGRSWDEVSYPYGGDSSILLEDLFFLDKEHGWILCSVEARRAYRYDLLAGEHIILRTEDGGAHFEQVRLPSLPPEEYYHYGNMDFVDQQVGWIALGGFGLLHTSDGGRTWNLVLPFPGTKLSLTSCSFPTRMEGWAVGYGGVAAHTRDGGKTWEIVKTGVEHIPDVHLFQVIFADEKHGWITGMGGIYPSDFPFQKPGHMISFVLKYVP
jgi:photosystem II stability/assembly factor-like uncharacterized protein